MKISGIYKDTIISKNDSSQNFKTFEPLSLNEINYEITDCQQLLIKEIYSKVGSMNTIYRLNSEFFLNINKCLDIIFLKLETVSSSQIEHTTSTYIDVLTATMNTNDNDLNLNLNYHRALTYALENIEQIPISNRLIKKLNEDLLKGTKGVSAYVGTLRETQNWIGSKNKQGGLKNARFIPCSVQSLNNHLEELYNFIHYNEMDKVVKCALAHYQFETIHPFIDGNGRVGRMLILIQLISDQVIKYPCFLPSYCFKKNQIKYFELLTKVRTEGDYTSWVTFFLENLLDSLIITDESLTNIYIGYMKSLKLISAINSKEKLLTEMLRYSIEHITFSNGDIAKEFDISFNTATKFTNLLLEMKILSLYDSGNKKHKTFMNTKFKELLDTLEK
ncbi:MAG: Fic family protein [Mycoplasma sp.]